MMQKPIRKWIKVLGAVVVGIALTVGAIAASSYASPWMVMSSVQKAWKDKDGAALADMVDWQAVRDGASRRLAYNLLTSYGLQPGDERVPGIIATVEESIGKMVTPENAERLMAETKWSQDKLIVKGKYLSMGSFLFAVESKDAKAAVSIKLRRKGPWTWKIDDVEVLDLTAGMGGK